MNCVIEPAAEAEKNLQVAGGQRAWREESLGVVNIISIVAPQHSLTFLLLYFSSLMTYFKDYLASNVFRSYGTLGLANMPTC